MHLDHLREAVSFGSSEAHVDRGPLMSSCSKLDDGKTISIFS
jgi:hypothetical protein